MNLEDVTRAIRSNRIRISDHADEESVSDGLVLDDVFFSVLSGEIIEDYPEDNPYPSCLIFGMTTDNVPVHSVWAYNELNGWCVLVTVYRPDPNSWIDWRERRT